MREMTLEDYRCEVIKNFHEMVDGHYLKDDIENFIESNEERIKKSYNTDKKLIEMKLGTFDPGGLAYAMAFEF